MKKVKEENINVNESILYQLRKEKGLTQKDIGKIIGVTRRNYGYYETGITPLPSDVAYKLADFYQTSTDYILERTNIRKPYPKKEIKIKEVVK